jgi:hypothetical protein
VPEEKALMMKNNKRPISTVTTVERIAATTTCPKRDRRDTDAQRGNAGTIVEIAPMKQLSETISQYVAKLRGGLSSK